MEDAEYSVYSQGIGPIKSLPIETIKLALYGPVGLVTDPGNFELVIFFFFFSEKPIFS